MFKPEEKFLNCPLRVCLNYKTSFETAKLILFFNITKNELFH